MTSELLKGGFSEVLGRVRVHMQKKKKKVLGKTYLHPVKPYSNYF